MQQLAEPAPSPNAPSFAGLLAALAAPTPSKSEPAWDDTALADDVATLSYEKALKSFARYRAPDPGDWPRTPPPAPQPSQLQSASTGFEPAEGCETAPLPAQTESTFATRNLKSASITIRLSEAECAQLRNRAAEASLTISAYLRSCTFEAESLRAQVKDALAQLRPVAAASEALSPSPPKSTSRSWLRRLLSH
ncbi:MAG: plasmid mobilization protein [Terracidiphilus sp.]